MPNQDTVPPPAAQTPPVYMTADSAAKLAGIDNETVYRRLGQPDALVLSGVQERRLYLQDRIHAEMQPGGRLVDVRRGRPRNGEYHPARGTTTGDGGQR
jgi:hypothetical protein